MSCSNVRALVDPLEEKPKTVPFGYAAFSAGVGFSLSGFLDVVLKITCGRGVCVCTR